MATRAAPRGRPGTPRCLPPGPATALPRRWSGNSRPAATRPSGAGRALRTTTRSPHPSRRPPARGPPRTPTPPGRPPRPAPPAALARTRGTPPPAAPAAAGTSFGRTAGSRSRPRQLAGGVGQTGPDVLDRQFGEVGEQFLDGHAAGE